MSPEAQRIAIAEACPGLFWKGQYEDDFAWNKDVLADLNAINAAAMTLTGRAREVYAYYLFNLPGDVYAPSEYIGYLEESASNAFLTYTSSAAKCTEALLRTLGKWDDTK